MTLLTIVQAASDELSLTRPDSVIGNTDDEVVKLLRYANRSGLRLMKMFPWQVLRTEHSFTSIAGTEQTGILPADFDRFVPETFWNRSESRFMSGPVSSVEWQSLVGVTYAGNERKFAQRGNSILVYPALSAGATLAFEYISVNWCQSSGGTGQSAWAADTDTGVLDEELITLRMVLDYAAAENLPANKAAADYQEYLDLLTANERSNGNILAVADIFGPGRRFSGAPLTTGERW